MDECQRDLNAYDKAQEEKYMNMATEEPDPNPYDYSFDEIYPDQYTHAPCCLNCAHNDICGCGEFGDSGICLLYKERAENE